MSAAAQAYGDLAHSRIEISDLQTKIALLESALRQAELELNSLRLIRNLLLRPGIDGAMPSGTAG